MATSTARATSTAISSAHPQIGDVAGGTDGEAGGVGGDGRSVSGVGGEGGVNMQMHFLLEEHGPELPTPLT